MIDLRALNFFRTVADAGSVTAAAREHIVSQPAGSRMIAGLEKTLGVRLFRRTALGMRLTPAGERLHEMATDVLVRIERAEHVMQTMFENRPVFSVACPETTAIFSVAPFVAETGAPILDIWPFRPADVYVGLAEGADFAVGTIAPPRQYKSATIVDVPIRVQFPGHPGWVEPGGSIELSQLVEQRLVMPGYGSAVERHVLDVVSEHRLAFDFAHVTRNGTIAQAFSAAGRGVALVTEPPQFGLNQASLVSGGKPLSITLYAAWEEDHYAAEFIAALVDDFIEWMRNRYVPGPLNNQR